MKTYLICISLFFFSAASYSTQLDDSDLTLEPTDSIDSELAAHADLSKLELELDARITYEAARGGTNLDALTLIEHELIASSISETNPVLLSRILQLKYLALDKEAASSITYIQNTESIEAKSEARRRKGRSASAQTESDPPVLTAISVDKVSVDVTQEAQTVTFTVEATDATGVDWDTYLTAVALRDKNGKFFYARSSSETPGVFTVVIDSNDPSGTWTIAWLWLSDTLANKKDYFYNSSLASLGLPASIEIVGGVESDPPVLTAISVDKVSVDVTQEAQTVTFTVEATDATGVDWDSNLTAVALRDKNGKFFYARSSSETPGVFTVVIDSNDPSGTWTIAWLWLSDTLANKKDYFYNSSLASLGLPASIEIVGGVESDPPVLTAISVDKVSVDVTQEAQTVTFTVEATDATGVDWDSNLTAVALRDKNGKFFYARSSSETPGVFTVVIDSNDPSGTWTIAWLWLSDTLANKKDYFYNSSLAPLGLPSFLYVLSIGESTTNISLSADDSVTNVSPNSEQNYTLTIENLASTPSGQLTLELESTNVRVNAVSQTGSSACSISSVNYNSTVSCELSGVDANSSKQLNLTLSAGASGTGSFNANIVASIPDISYLNNYLTVSLGIDSDSDGDGIGDHNDAFPLDPAESLDTDSDGIGNNADTDDDGDSLSDQEEINLGLNPFSDDTDNDGINDSLDESTAVFKVDFPHVEITFITPGITPESGGLRFKSPNSIGVNNFVTLDQPDCSENKAVFKYTFHPLTPSGNYSIGNNGRTVITYSDGGRIEDDSNYSFTINNSDGVVGTPKVVEYQLKELPNNRLKFDLLFSNATGGIALASPTNQQNLAAFIKFSFADSIDSRAETITMGLKAANLIEIEGGFFKYSNSFDVPEIYDAGEARVFQLGLLDAALNELFAYIDSDNDLAVDQFDAFPSDPNEYRDSDEDGIGNYADLDDDNDGVNDSTDMLPLDATETLDTDGDGIGNNADADDDNDTFSDVDDAFPLDAAESVDTDSDGIGNNADTDDDNDGVADSEDAFPFDLAESSDFDEDGVGDNADLVNTTLTFSDGIFDINVKVNDPSDNPVTFIDLRFGGASNNHTCFVSATATEQETQSEDVYQANFKWAIGENYGTKKYGVIDDTPVIHFSDGTKLYDQNQYFLNLTNLNSVAPQYKIESFQTTQTDIDNEVEFEIVISGFGEDGFLLKYPTSSGGLLDIKVHFADSADYVGVDFKQNDVEKIANDRYVMRGKVVISDTEDFMNPKLKLVSMCDASLNGKAWDQDSDQDGMIDALDAFPQDSSEISDTDFDGIGNNVDTDDDGDGVLDSDDVFPLDATETQDADGDGIGDNIDLDTNGDGFYDDRHFSPLDLQNLFLSSERSTTLTDDYLAIDSVGQGEPVKNEVLYRLPVSDAGTFVSNGFFTVAIEMFEQRNFGSSDKDFLTGISDGENVILFTNNDTSNGRAWIGQDLGQTITEASGISFAGNFEHYLVSFEFNEGQARLTVEAMSGENAGYIESRLVGSAGQIDLSKKLELVLVGNQADENYRLEQMNILYPDRDFDGFLDLFTRYDSSSIFSDWVTFSEDTLTISSKQFSDHGGFDHAVSIDSVDSGKHYWEVTAFCGHDTKGFGVGVADTNWLSDNGGKPSDYFLYDVFSDVTASPVYEDDVIQVALDMDSKHIYFGKNGTWLDGADPVVGVNPSLDDLPLRVYAHYTTGNRECVPLTTRTNFGNSVFSHEVPDGYFKGFCPKGNCPVADDDFDNDGILNFEDDDDDNDSVLDVDDAFPRDSSESVDTDSDGIGDNIDLDTNGDGFYDDRHFSPLDLQNLFLSSERSTTLTDDYLAIDSVGQGEPVKNEVLYRLPVSDAGTFVSNGFFTVAIEMFEQRNFGSSDKDFLTGISDGENVILFTNNDTSNGRAWIGQDLGQTITEASGISFAGNFEHYLVSFEFNEGQARLTVEAMSGENAGYIESRLVGSAGQIDLSKKLELVLVGNQADENYRLEEMNILYPDRDFDGFLNTIDDFPLDFNESTDTDGDGIGNNADADDDNDGVADVDDAFPLDPTRSVVGSNTAPTIAIEGAATMTLNVGETFTDPGALAVDDEDGDLTASVIVIDPVDSSAPGLYTVEYRVTDSGGLTSTVTRTVTVIQPLSSGAIRFAAGQVIELPVIGTALTAPNGEALVVPTTATAASINVTAVTPGGSGFITVWPCGVARPLASNLNYVAGDVVPNGVLAPIGSNGKVCLYSLVDTDLVVDVAGWFEGDAFVGATPLRLRDTRDTSRVTSTQELVLQVADIDASTADGSATKVPVDVGAVALNVTVVSPDSAGFVTVYPCGTRPLASNVNYTAGQIVPNGVIAPVSADGKVCIYSLAPTDIIVDLAGWFPGDAFTAATPQRLVDTRDGTGGQQGKLTPTGQLNVPVHGQTLSVSGNSAQVPLTATAAALNVTIVNPESAGFATVWPCSAARPLASNLNFVSGQVVANNVIAPIGDQGGVCFYTNVPSDIIVDIAGYFSGEDGNQFVGSTPKRFIDTRSSLGPAPGAEPVKVEPILPTVQLLEDRFPFSDRISNLPFSSTSTTNVTIVGNNRHTLAEYKLQVSETQATLVNIVATDRNGFTSPQFVGLSEGMIVAAGSAVEFSLVTGLTGGRTSDLFFSFEVMETGDSFSSVYVFRSN